MRRPLGVTAALLVMASLVMGSAAAADNAVDPIVDFAVSPSRLELRVEPGDALEVPIEVLNRGTTLTLDTYVEDIGIPLGELVDPDELAFTASRWVTFAAPTLAVEPAATGQALLRIAIPETTPSGGYHAFAFFQSRPIEGGHGIVPAGRIGITLLLEVAPGDKELVRAARVSEEKLSVRWNGPFDPDVVARTTIDNTGEAHLVTGGVHTYRRWPGTAAADVRVGPHTTLRGTRHTFETTWDAVPLIGKVTLTSELVYQVTPDDLPVILTQHTIWIIPWHLIGVLLAAATMAVFVIRRRRNRTTQIPWRETEFA